MKKNKILLKSLILLSIILIAIIVYQIIHIYAVFNSEVSGNIEFEKGKWNIFVNGTEISSGIDKEFVIDTINVDNAANVKEGRLAPGVTGDFEISINPTNTNVSVRYDISLNQEGLTNKNIKIKSIEETAEGNSLINTAENTYTGIMPLEKIQTGVVNNIKVEIEWKNEEENNEEDTELGVVYNSKLEIPIKVHFSQYLGEEIKGM